MTTCPRCGQPIQPGTAICAMCGTPLAPAASAAAPALDDSPPPWLRELQASQAMGYGQPAVPNPYAPLNQPLGYQQAPQQGYGQPSQGYGQPPQAQPLSAGGLVSEDALPEWLRTAATGDLHAPPGSGRLGSGAAGYGQPANALFDESALPDWLRQASMGQEMEGAPHGNPPAAGMPSTYAGNGAAASSPRYGPSQADYNGYQGSPPPGQGMSGALPYNRPAATAFPSIEQVGMYQPAPPPGAGLAARSLLDSGMLPPWMGGQPGAAAPLAGGGPSNPGGMPAQSLIDETALPQWLRAEPSSPAAGPAYGNPGAIGASAGMPAPTPTPGPNGSSWLAASTAAEPLPSWLNQMYADANVPRVEPRQAGAPATPGGSSGLGAPAYGAPNYHGQPLNGMRNPSDGTIAASDFVDESALPDWLKQQGAVENPPPSSAYAPPTSSVAMPSVASSIAPMPPLASMPRPETVAEHRAAPLYQPGSSGRRVEEPGLAASNASDGAPPTRFAASDLIDPSALPSWVAGQEPQQASFNSRTGWTVKQPAVAPGHANGVEAGMSAGMPGELAGADSYAANRGRPSEWQQPAAPSSRRDENRGGYGRMPEPEPSGYRPGNGIGKRGGAPIRREELPPWLQGADAGSAGAAYGQQDQWDDADQAEQPQWDDWDDEAFNEAEDGYPREDEYAHYSAEGQQAQRGGWRRFFGRR